MKVLNEEGYKNTDAAIGVTPVSMAAYLEFKFIFAYLICLYTLEEHELSILRTKTLKYNFPVKFHAKCRSNILNSDKFIDRKKSLNKSLYCLMICVYCVDLIQTMIQENNKLEKSIACKKGIP